MPNDPNPRIRPWFLLGVIVVICANISTSFGQALPSGGGPIPPLRRGAGGQIEIVPPDAPSRPEIGQRDTFSVPKATPSGSIPHPAAPAARSKASPRPAQLVIMVAPISPHVPNTTPRGAVVATYSVKMTDGSPFTGTVRFGAPYYDAGGVFALSGNKIIVNPNGPGLGRNNIAVVKHITLQANS